MSFEGDSNGGRTSEPRSFNREQTRRAFQKDIPQEEQTNLPLLGLHQALEEAGAYEKIRREKHRKVLQAYLVTDLPMGELREIAGVKNAKVVGSIVHRSLQKVFPYLPPKVQDEYKSPKEAIRRKASKLMPVSRERQMDKETGTFYPEHRQHLSEGQKRRWQRRREQKTGEQTIVDFTETDPPKSF